MGEVFRAAAPKAMKDCGSRTCQSVRLWVTREIFHLAWLAIQKRIDAQHGFEQVAPMYDQKMVLEGGGRHEIVGVRRELLCEDCELF